eukprot:9473473-Pyramimonas_sp.AAC.1
MRAQVAQQQGRRPLPGRRSGADILLSDPRHFVGGPPCPMKLARESSASLHRRHLRVLAKVLVASIV